jgi:transposase
MTRKQRKMLTPELYESIKRFAFQENKDTDEISRLLDFSPSAVRKTLRDIRDGKPFIPANVKKKNTTRLKNQTFDAVEQTIFNEISINNSSKQSEIKDKILETHNVNISIPTISRKLKKLKITRKRLTLVPIERNSPEKIDARAIYCTDVSRFPLENLVFLDETGFSNHTTRSYGYSPVNTPAIITLPANRGVNRSCLLMMDFQENIRKEIKVGAFDGSAFAAFKRNQMIPYFADHPNKILIMDNCRIHYSREALDTLTLNRIPYKFMPPYSPQLNPCEEFFSMLKARFKTARIANPTLRVEETLNSVLQDNFSVECSRFYINQSRWFDKGRNREPFI